MRKLDILTEKQGARYHWYAVDMVSKQATHEGCCSVYGKGGKCEGFEDENSALQNGDTWNNNRQN